MNEKLIKFLKIFKSKKNKTICNQNKDRKLRR